MTVGVDSFTGAGGITNDPCAEFVRVAVGHIQRDAARREGWPDSTDGVISWAE